MVAFWDVNSRARVAAALAWGSYSPTSLDGHDGICTSRVSWRESRLILRSRGSGVQPVSLRLPACHGTRPLPSDYIPYGIDPARDHFSVQSDLSSSAWPMDASSGSPFAVGDSWALQLCLYTDVNNHININSSINNKDTNVEAFRSSHSSHVNHNFLIDRLNGGLGTASGDDPVRPRSLFLPSFPIFRFFHFFSESF